MCGTSSGSRHAPPSASRWSPFARFGALRASQAQRFGLLAQRRANRSRPGFADEWNYFFKWLVIN